MAKTLKETAQAIFDKKNELLTETANADTLKPNSKLAEPTKTLGGPATTTEQPKAPGEGDNAGAIASSVVQKDKSTPTKTAKTDDQVVNQEQPAIRKEEVEVDEDIELSEELTAFIDGLVAEGKTEEEIAQAIEENFELVEDEMIEESAEKIEESTEKEPEYTVDMSEHVNALFEGEELSEEFKSKATTIFEAAVKQVVEMELQKFEKAYADTLAEEVNSINEAVSSKVDDYLDYVINEWVSDNEVAIESGLRNELTEDFMTGLKNVFLENYIDIPEDKVNILEEMTTKVAELEAKLNEEIESNVTLNKLLSESKKTEKLNALTEGLTSTQAEKLKTLAEGVEYDNLDTFETKVKTLREGYFPSAPIKNSDTLDPIEPGTEGKTMMVEEDGRMGKYVRALGRQTK